MARKSLVNVVADTLRDRIVSGQLAVGGALPSEAELRQEFDVSRVTIREALRVLTAEGLVRVASGIGATVNPLDLWQSLDALMRYHSATGDDGEVAVQLLTVRRMFESEAAAGAAENATEEDFAELRLCLEQMRRGHAEDNLETFVEADLRFHDLIMKRSGNIFLAALFEPITRVLAERRAQTSRIPEIQRNALREHAEVLAALESRDPAAARSVMQAHFASILDSLVRHVLSKG